MSDSDELGKLADLHQRGALSDDEFLRAKARILGAAASPNSMAHTGADLNALRRSRDDRWLGGVCGGIGRFTASPAWIWRLLFTLFVICAGSGFLIYILMWIFIPADPQAAPFVRQSYS